MSEFSLKVAALVIKEFDDGYRLLVHGFEHDRTLPLRFPGGGVEPGEIVEEALHRELLEETGLTGLKLVRKLGVVRFFKPYSGRYVERHDYLMLAEESTRTDWSFEVKGSGSDAGEVFTFRWSQPEEFYLIDIELQKFLDREHIPELF